LGGGKENIIWGLRLGILKNVQGLGVGEAAL